MTRPIAWAWAFARQAQADLDTWERLQELDSVPECHKLQFFQMACEKLTKAHLCRMGSDPGSIQTSHAYIAKTLPTIIRLRRGLNRSGNAEWIRSHSGHIAREVELLAPAVKSGGQRPDNCEYPWEDAEGRVHSPLDWTFNVSALLLAPAGRTFIKLIREAVGGFV